MYMYMFRRKRGERGERKGEENSSQVTTSDSLIRTNISSTFVAFSALVSMKMASTSWAYCDPLCLLIWREEGKEGGGREPMGCRGGKRRGEGERKGSPWDAGDEGERAHGMQGRREKEEEREGRRGEEEEQGENMIDSLRDTFTRHSCLIIHKSFSISN